MSRPKKTTRQDPRTAGDWLVIDRGPSLGKGGLRYTIRVVEETEHHDVVMQHGLSYDAALLVAARLNGLL